MAYNHPYPGMPPPGAPHLPPHHQPHPGHVPPTAPGLPPNPQRQEEYVQVKTRYRDQCMTSTFKMHVFAEEAVLGQLSGEAINLYRGAEIKRNPDEHCITLSKLGKLTHYAEIQLFRTLSRYGFTLKSSTSSVIPMSEHVNDVLCIHVFGRYM